MLTLNITHPLTSEHRATIEQLAEVPIDEFLTIRMQIDDERSLAAQIAYQPPGYATAACALLAEIHGANAASKLCEERS